MSTSGSSTNLDISATTTDSQPSSHVTGRSIPLAATSRYHSTGEDGDELPSNALRYSVWHNLRSVRVLGSDLRAPRIRHAPGIDRLATLPDERELIHHSLKGRELKQHRNTTEDWENSELVNLSFQDLNHEYQRQNFHRILDRIPNAQTVNLTDNGLVNLSSHTFAACTILVLDNNYISSFRKLPRLPNITFLSLKCNDISTLAGLSNLRKSPLEYLLLQGNPVTFTHDNFRQRVFQTLSGLKVLDDVPRLNSDMEFDHQHPHNGSGSCNIS